MEKKTKIKMKLKTDAKRAYIYQYGPEQNMDGRITIAKSCFEHSEEIDFVVEIEERTIEVVNCSEPGYLIPTQSFQIDEQAIHVLCDIFDAYDDTGKVPVKS